MAQLQKGILVGRGPSPTEVQRLTLPPLKVTHSPSHTSKLPLLSGPKNTSEHSSNVHTQGHKLQGENVVKEEVQSEFRRWKNARQYWTTFYFYLDNELHDSSPKLNRNRRVPGTRFLLLPCNFKNLNFDFQVSYSLIFQPRNYGYLSIPASSTESFFIGLFLYLFFTPLSWDINDKENCVPSRCTVEWFIRFPHSLWRDCHSKSANPHPTQTRLPSAYGRQWGHLRSNASKAQV